MFFYLLIGSIMYAWYYYRTHPTIRFKRLHPDAMVPTYASNGAAGFDLSVCCPGETICVRANSVSMLPTGFAMAVPPNHEMQIRSRSGMTKRGLVVANGVGTIDSDYRGEVKILLWNRSGDDVVMSHGARVAQGVVTPVNRVSFVERERLGDTARGTNGFGSTG